MQLELGKSYLRNDSEQIQIVRYSESNGFFFDCQARAYFPNGISVTSLLPLKEICKKSEQDVVSKYLAPSTSKLDETLSERGKRYGAFSGHAEITQGLKERMASCDNWSKLSPSQKEALEMIAHKIGRILNGDPNYADSWVDIAGYSQLIVKELENAVDKTATSSK